MQELTCVSQLIVYLTGRGEYFYMKWWCISEYA